LLNKITHLFSKTKQNLDYCVVIVLELIATTLTRDKTNHLVTFQTNKFQKFAIKNLFVLF